jgi:hypothetical protein
VTGRPVAAVASTLRQGSSYGKRYWGEPGHTRDTRTDEPHNHPNPPTHPSDRETTESAADSTAAAPATGTVRKTLGFGRSTSITVLERAAPKGARTFQAGTP